MAEPSLPDEYTYGYVVAKAISAVADSTPMDDPYPDGPPISLPRSIIFRPVDISRVTHRVSPEPSIRARNEGIAADLDDEGYLSLNGQRGLWLYTGTWKVFFDERLGWPPYEIAVTTDHTTDHPLDLWQAAGWQPTDTDTIVTLLVPATVHDGDVLIRRGDHVDGVAQEAFRGPTGPTGPVGPVGPVGQPSPFQGVGPGRPDIPSTLDTPGQAWVQSAPVGAIWCSTDGAGTGAWQWQRTPSGWLVITGDTGTINVTTRTAFTSAITDGATVTVNTSSPVVVRRFGALVQIDFVVDKADSSDHTSTSGLPAGWRPRIAATISAVTFGGTTAKMLLNGGTSRSIISGPSKTGYTAHVLYLTDDPWPDSL